MTKALEIQNLSMLFGGARTLLGKKKPQVQAVKNVSFSVESGETLGIIGESGCGKSTLAKMLVGLQKPTSGKIILDGKDLGKYAGRDPAAFGRLIQYVFQDPISSLNPRKTIRQIMLTPLKELHNIQGKEADRKVLDVFDAVKLRNDFLDRYPHEFSGGQAQRIGIARALAAFPKILILDEPVSALDVSVQAQVLNLLESLKKDFSLTYLFITHDLAVVEAIADRIAVLYFGNVVEIGPANEIFLSPKHPYTELLANSVPVIGKNLQVPEDVDAELPDPFNPPQGCAFANRCLYSSKQCYQSQPMLKNASPNQSFACFNPIQDNSTLKKRNNRT